MFFKLNYFQSSVTGEQKNDYGFKRKTCENGQYLCLYVKENNNLKFYYACFVFQKLGLVTWSRGVSTP